jgi:hypothetical protein
LDASAGKCGEIELTETTYGNSKVIDDVRNQRVAKASNRRS